MVRPLWGEWCPGNDVTVDKKRLTYMYLRLLKSPIAHVPSEGYVKRDQCSLFSIEKGYGYMMHVHQVHIKHSFRGNEKQVFAGKSAENLVGFTPDESSQTAGIYWDYVWHNFPKCYLEKRDSTIKGMKNDTLQIRYNQTLKRKS